MSIVSKSRSGCRNWEEEKRDLAEHVEDKGQDADVAAPIFDR
jgi:hypothetical protein